MAYYYKSIKFCEATTLIKFIRNNAERIKSESINGIYYTSNLSWYEHTPEKKVWITDTCLIIEFDTFVIQIDYYFSSDMLIKIVDRDSFYKGELTRSIYDYQTMLKNPQPFEKNEDLNVIDNPICEVIIERFSHEFEVNPSEGTVRISGGDYFDSVIFMMGDVGLRMCPEDSIMDGYLDYELFYKRDVDVLKPHKDVYYERIVL